MKSRLFRKAMTSIIGAASALLLGGTILASAAPPQTVYNSPYISWSPDGQVWTLCRGDKNTKHYPYETTVYTGISSSMPQPDIDRILDPHNPIFKAGESGRLYLTTWGYCEYIELFFPEELTSRDERLVDVIVDYRELTKFRYDDIYQFQIPLYVPDGLYAVHVVAHRDDLIREDWPTFIVDHSHGYLLDEFRDRMK